MSVVKIIIDLQRAVAAVINNHDKKHAETVRRLNHQETLDSDGPGLRHMLEILGTLIEDADNAKLAYVEKYNEIAAIVGMVDNVPFKQYDKTPAPQNATPTPISPQLKAAAVNAATIINSGTLSSQTSMNYDPAVVAAAALIYLNPGESAPAPQVTETVQEAEPFVVKPLPHLQPLATEPITAPLTNPHVQEYPVKTKCMRQAEVKGRVPYPGPCSIMFDASKVSIDTVDKLKPVQTYWPPRKTPIKESKCGSSIDALLGTRIIDGTAVEKPKTRREIAEAYKSTVVESHFFDLYAVFTEELYELHQGDGLLEIVRVARLNGESSD